MKKIKELSLTIYIILNLIYISLGSMLFTIKKIKYIDYSRGYIILLILNILVLLAVFIIKKHKNKIKLNIIDLALLMIILFSIISVVFSINKNVSIFMISTYIDKQQKKIISYAIILSGIINLLYGVFQIFELEGIIIKYNWNRPWATGFVNNPNFFGTLMLLCLTYSLGLFIDETRLSLKIINGLLIFIFMLGLLISNAMSCLVGLIIIIICISIYTIIKRKYIKLLILILVLSTSTFLIIKADKTKLVRDFIKTKNQTIEIVKGNIEDNYGTNRIFIWKNTLKIVPDNMLTGVGIDNFYYAFGKQPLYDGKWVFDKAHNEYLQILVTEGIFSLLSYLLFYGIITIKGLKNSFKDKQLYLVLPIIGYLTQAFFNISVIEVAPFFYIALGLLVDRGINNEESKRNNTST